MALYPSDPHIGGACSYLKTGQYTEFTGIQGRRRGNLHFAGEHTSVNFQGDMEAACAAAAAAHGRSPAADLNTGDPGGCHRGAIGGPPRPAG